VVATRVCPNCGIDRRERDRFCRKCGVAFETSQAKLSATPPAAAARPVESVWAPSLPRSTDASPSGQTMRLEPASTPTPLLPAPPPTQQRQPARATSRFASRLPFKPLALLGGILLVVASIVPWVSAAVDANALDISIDALWDIQTSGEGPIKIGYVLIALGVLGGGLSFAPPTKWVRRICGSISIAVALAFAVQLFRAIDAGGGSPGDVFSAIGVGVYVALGGGILLLVSR
jgi:hypothetical protein